MSNPTRPKRDGYGNIVNEPAWYGYTLDDLAEFARTGQPVSTVQPGQTGYGLDEVGNAEVYQPGGTAKGPGFDWKRAVGGALAGLAAAQPEGGAANIGRGFVMGTQWGDERDQNARRNALTESQTQYQSGLNDLNQLKILDYPQDRAREAGKYTAELDRTRAQTEETRARIADILAGTAGDQAMLPLEMDTERAQAENYRERPGGRGAASREDWIANKAATLMARSQYDEEGYRTQGLSVDEALQMATELWEKARGGTPAPGRGQPASGVTRPSVLEAPFATLGGDYPRLNETAQEYADRVGPKIGGAEARRRWQAQAGPRQ